MTSIYISIKPKYTCLIENMSKNHEFRNYVPKKDFDTLYVYESYPTCMLKYIIKVGKITKFPNTIDEDGVGNKEFNNGKCKYAYEIKKLYKLDNPITLKELKEKHNFNPPQSYSYKDTYKTLTHYLQTIKLIKIK